MDWAGGAPPYRLYKDFFLAQGMDLEPDMEVATSDLMLPLIESNLGIGFVPKDLAAPFLEKGELVQIPLCCASPRRSIQIVADKGRGKSLAADALYKYLSAYCTFDSNMFIMMDRKECEA